MRAITLRAATPQDAEIMTKVKEDAVGNVKRQYHSLAVRSMQDRLKRPDAWSQLALIGQRVVGFAIGHARLDADDRPTNVQELDFLMVLPNYWGSGIGSQLLLWAAKYHRDRNAQCIELSVIKNDARACRLYERHGYEVITGDTPNLNRRYRLVL